MTSFLSKIPTYRKIFHAVFNWRNARRALLTLAVIVTLIAVFYAEEDWRGEHDWQAYQAKLVAQGVPMSLDQLQPAKVPDDQNFAMVPIIRSLCLPMGAPESQMEGKLSWDLVTPNGDDKIGDWYNQMYTQSAKYVGLRAQTDALRKTIGQEDLVQAMSKFSPVLDEFTAASRLLTARFPIADDFSNFADLPYTPLLRLGKIYRLRALAEFDQGQTQNAADDICTVYRLGNLFSKAFPLLMQLTCTSVYGTINQSFQAGLAEHRWSDAQLAQMEAEMQKCDGLADLQRSLQAERIRYNKIFRSDAVGNTLKNFYWSSSQLNVLMLEPLMPQGWFSQNQINYGQESLKFISYLDLAKHKVDVAAVSSQRQDLLHRSRTPYNFFSLIAVSVDEGVIPTQVRSMAMIDEAQVACAIERYRLVNGKIPATLDELAPRFIVKVPNDIFSGGPLHYQSGVNGHYQLYEIGANGKDHIAWPDTATP